MRYTTTSLFCAFVLSLTLSVSRADTPAAPATPTSPNTPSVSGPGQEKETELGGKMGQMGKAFKKLRKQVTDPTQNASSLELTAKMRQAAEESLKLTPEKAETLPEAERPKFVADYQDGIKKLITQIDALSAAFTANDNALAEKTLKEMGAYQRDAHKEFRKPRQP